MTKPEFRRLLAYLKTLPPSKEREFFIKKMMRDTKKITPRSAKNKGAGLQKWIRDRISVYSGIPCGEGDDAKIASRTMGLSGTDIILRGEARKAFPFAVEAKNTETFSVWSVVEQAKSNLSGFKYWLIVHKKNGEKPIVVLDFEDFMDIYFNKGVDKKE